MVKKLHTIKDGNLSRFVSSTQHNTDNLGLQAEHQAGHFLIKLESIKEYIATGTAPVMMTEMFSSVGFTESGISKHYNLTTLLTAETLHSPVKKVPVLGKHASVNNAIQNPGVTVHHTFQTRPFIEALFHERIDLFHALVGMLIKNGSEKMYNEFVAALAGTELGNTSALFNWHDGMASGIAVKVDAIRQLGAKLDPKATKEEQAQAKLLKSLAETLDEQVDALKKKPRSIKLEPSYRIESKGEQPTSLRSMPEFMRNLYVLEFKLRFMDTLHRHDHTSLDHAGKGLNEQSKWGKFKIGFANFISILFAGLANLALRAYTHNAYNPRWALAAPTKAQALIENLDNAFDASVDETFKQGPKVTFRHAGYFDRQRKTEEVFAESRPRGLGFVNK